MFLFKHGSALITHEPWSFERLSTPSQRGFFYLGGLPFCEKYFFADMMATKRTLVRKRYEIFVGRIDVSSDDQVVRVLRCVEPIHVQVNEILRYSIH